MKKVTLLLALFAIMGIASLTVAMPAKAQFSGISSLPGIVDQVISLLTGARPTVTPQPTDERPQVLYGQDIVINQPIKGDLIAAGGRVTIEASVAGDLIVAGGLVQVNAPVGGDVLGVGGLMNFGGRVDNDVRIAGIGVNLDSTIAKNAMVATAFLRQSQRSAVNGSLMAYAYRAWLNGAIGGNLDIKASEVTLDAIVGGDVNVEAKNLNIQKNAQVVEDVNATLLVEPTIDPNAKVQGNVNVTIQEVASPAAKPAASPEVGQQSLLPFVGTVYAQDDSQKADEKELEKEQKATNDKMRWFFGSILVTLVGGSFMLWLFPTYQNGQVYVLEKKTALTTVAGWLWIFMGLIASILLLITIIGAPIGFALLLIWIATMIMAPWAVAQALGHVVLRRWQIQSSIMRNSYFHLLVGATLLAMLMLLPYIGWTVRLIVWTLGMGAPVYWLLNKPQAAVSTTGAQQSAPVATTTTKKSTGKKKS
jgi:cytoskeletal protein CcmA (bactofilin family)